MVFWNEMPQTILSQDDSMFLKEAYRSFICFIILSRKSCERMSSELLPSDEHDAGTRNEEKSVSPGLPG